MSTNKIETGESVVKQSMQPGGNVTWQQTVSDVVSDKVGGMVTKNVNVNATTSAQNKLNRSQRIAESDPTSSGRQKNVQAAQNDVYNEQLKNSTISEVTGNSFQETSNSVRNQKLEIPAFIMQNKPAKDNINVNKIVPVYKF